MATPVRSSPPVLTYYPEMERSQEIADFIKKHNLPVYLSAVEGVPAELRIGFHEWVNGDHQIMEYLKERFADIIAQSA
jgi:hypothetical protein